MDNLNELLDRVEAKGLWAFFHKDWLLEMRTALRPQLPPEYHLFVESESILVAPDSIGSATPVLPDLSVARDEGVRTSTGRTVSSAAKAAVIEIDEEVEIVSTYSLLIRRVPENRIVGALEVISPTNKGASSRLEREKYLSKRQSYLEAGVSFLEIDALKQGPRLLPPALAKLDAFERNAWTAYHLRGRRRIRGHGWNHSDPLPSVPWTIDESLTLTVDFPATLQAACEFNRWEQLV